MNILARMLQVTKFLFRWTLTLEEGGKVQQGASKLPFYAIKLK